MIRKIPILTITVIVLLLPVGIKAEGSGEDDIEEELLRQLEGIDLSLWDEYFDSLASFEPFAAESFDQLVFELAGGQNEGDPGGSLRIIKSMVISELKKASGGAALLCACALLSSLSAILPGEGMKRPFSVVLSSASVVVSAGMIISLIDTAKDALDKMGRLTEKTAPIICASLTAMGSGSSIKVFDPVLTLLSEGVIVSSGRLVMPLIIICGILSCVNAITDGDRLYGIVSFLRKAVKWILGLISVVYFGVIAVKGLNAAAKDGVLIRTSKYALDKMVPVVGGMIGGTVDNVMGCALLIKNGIGTCAIIILVSVIAKPVIILAAGAFIFRLSAAISGAVSDKTVINLYKSCAETVSNLFACVAVSAAMFILTIMVIITSGGYAAGLW